MHLVFDFDGTITQQDTIGELAQAAIDLQKRRHGLDLNSKWNRVVADYMSDYQAYKDSFKPAENARRSVAEELRFLAGLKDVEAASLARVEDSGVFSTLERGDLFQLGVDAVRTGKVAIRNGFEETVALAANNGWNISIISVNWSRAFIQGVLHPHSHIRVVSNDISPDGKIEGPRFLGTPLTTAPDKTKALGHLADNEGDKVIYFGDSPTDLECLLKGGVIIAFDESSSLLQTLRRVGVHASHVGSLQQEASLLWARDFHEVLQSVLLDDIRT